MWENPLIKSSYYSSKFQQRERTTCKIHLPNHCKTDQSNYNQQDAITRKSTLVKPAEKVLQMSSVKSSQLGLQRQFESTQNSTEILYQNLVNIESTALRSTLVKQLQIPQFLYQEMWPKEIGFPT